jgi:hypothetical protein
MIDEDVVRAPPKRRTGPAERRERPHEDPRSESDAYPREEAGPRRDKYDPRIVIRHVHVARIDG